MCSVLENKSYTWENLQKRCFQGPGWCALCKVVGESILHLFIHCLFIKCVEGFFQIFGLSLSMGGGVHFAGLGELEKISHFGFYESTPIIGYLGCMAHL